MKLFGQSYPCWSPDKIAAKANYFGLRDIFMSRFWKIVLILGSPWSETYDALKRAPIRADDKRLLGNNMSNKETMITSAPAD